MISGFDLDDFVNRVLAEDLGVGGDVTSAATISAEARFAAKLAAREPIVVAGLDIAAAFFEALDPNAEIERLVRDGDHAETG
ncbi:MAG: nicotinate-nucleotide diphosphorylase (carboxylating), partial [Pseudomonadota bacterium]|nr:nicotinate-nucleotide diphosphorylase (carboxylating) [Pseudomonadota bacterium]